MISTFAQVKTRVLALLDDPNGATFTDAILLPAIGEAVDALQSAFVYYEIPRSKAVATYTLPASTTSVTPATMGIADMGEIIELRERRGGSSDRYVHVYERDDLTQRDAASYLGEWEWRGDSLCFIGATVSRDLWLSYFATTEQPSALDGTTTGVDGALIFLSKYAAGVAGPRKGYDELAAMYMRQAVGNRYDDGVIGGDLFRLAQPMVRSRQRVQVAPRPFSVIGRNRVRRAAPFVAAQYGTTGGGSSMAPQQFSTATGTITGTLDGVNAQFFLAFPVTTVNIYRNGVFMTIGTDCTFGANLITFSAGQIPQPGDILTASGWV